MSLFYVNMGVAVFCSFAPSTHTILSVAFVELHFQNIVIIFGNGYRLWGFLRMFADKILLVSAYEGYAWQWCRFDLVISM